MAKAFPAILSLVPKAKPEPRPVFEARWTAPATWHVKAPWSGWTKAPGVWTEDEAPAAVRRAFGAQARDARIVVLPGAAEPETPTAHGVATP